MSEERFQKAIEDMDARNAMDPNTVREGECATPAALLYARRMAKTVDELYPQASDALKLAVRAQHIERWKLPRSDFPEGRAGYHHWRNEQKKRHAQTAADILVRAGYEEETMTRVCDLILKKQLATDPEAAALEDVACIVFFKYYAAEFASKHDPEKVAQIVTKTWRKMSAHGHAHAAKLDLPEPLQTHISKLAES